MATEKRAVERASRPARACAGSAFVLWALAGVAALHQAADLVPGARAAPAAPATPAIVAGRPMANIASQRKRIQRSERERLENRRLQGAVKTHFRRLESAVESGDSATIADEHRQLVSRIDKAVRKGALQSNNGARKKTRAARLLNRAAG